MSFAKAIKKEPCDSFETILRTLRLRFAGAHSGRIKRVYLTEWVFWTMAGRENPGSGRPEKNWAQWLGGDMKVFRATEESTEQHPLRYSE